MATNTLGRWVETYREALDLSQAELARQVAAAINNPKYGRDRIHHIEQGDAPEPDREVLQALADILGRPVAEPLAALGYRIQAPDLTPIHPALVAALTGVPWATQERLAALIPALLTYRES